MVDLDRILNQASSLMTEEFEKKMDIYKPKSFNGGRSGGSNDLSAMEMQAFGYSPSSPSYESTYNSKGRGQNQATNYDKLPEYMREDFKKNPPISYQESVPSYVTEQYAPQRQVSQQPQGNGVDYNYLKYLIGEAIRENVKTLNESSNMNDFRGMRISGNKIQFVDNKGNVYEGVLTLKKRVK